MGIVLADHADRPDTSHHRSRSRSRQARVRRDDADGKDRHRQDRGGPPRLRLRPTPGENSMDTKELHNRGVAVRKQIFGAEAVEKRMNALGKFGAPLQELINTYGYGDVWSRPGL